MEWNKNAVSTMSLNHFKKVCYHYVDNNKMESITEKAIETLYYKITGKEKPKKIKENATVSN